MLRKPNQTVQDLKTYTDKIIENKEQKIEYDAALILLLWSTQLLTFFAGFIIGLLF